MGSYRPIEVTLFTYAGEPWVTCADADERAWRERMVKRRSAAANRSQGWRARTKIGFFIIPTDR
jgi:hypothetical protein